MRHRGRWTRSILPVAAALLALFGSAAAQPTAPSAQKKQAARQDAWPRQVRMGETTVSLDAPQAESLEGTSLTARGTARVQRAGETVPSFGTIWYEAEVEINRDRRIVTLVSVRVPRVQLAGAPPAQQQRIATRLSQAVTRMKPKLQLDDVLAGVRVARGREQTPPKLNTEPPRILFETEPAVLVIFDGEPRFRAVEGSALERALNTPFLVLHDSNAYYLDGGTFWFRASNVTGPWTKTGDVPLDAVRIALRDLKDAGVPESEVKQASQSAEKRVPKILVATEPTELVVSDGAPQWNPAVAGELDAMSNSESDVFRTLPDQQIFLALSGRWYRSISFGGPWSYVEPDRLPESFRKIPADSPKAEVLAFVPGTGPAEEALADANKPRTAAVRRSDAHVSVTYDGEPRFEPVPGTRVEYALNTPEQVLRIHGRYYACDQGVWFSAAAPSGPWVVADSIPDEEIQSIPPESPVYNTRYAYVYDSTPEVVYVAYTPAYLGSYPYYGAVVFGTGWFYRPWWGAYYYPRPWTWGFHAMYTPWGGWGLGFGWGPAWGGFRYGFGFGWGARWCGPGGFYRPFYRNVNVTRNVTVNRNVNVTRNLYTSGANKSRAATTQAAAAKATSGPRRGAAQTARAAKAPHTGPSANAKGVSPGAAKPKPSKPHAPAHPGKGAGKKG